MLKKEKKGGTLQLYILFTITNVSPLPFFFLKKKKKKPIYLPAKGPAAQRKREQALVRLDLGPARQQLFNIPVRPYEPTCQERCSGRSEPGREVGGQGDCEDVRVCGLARWSVCLPACLPARGCWTVEGERWKDEKMKR